LRNGYQKAVSLSFGVPYTLKISKFEAVIVSQGSAFFQQKRAATAVFHMLIAIYCPESVDQVIVSSYEAQNEAVHNRLSLVIHLQEIPNEYR
jgi:hypothetical protein